MENNPLDSTTPLLEEENGFGYFVNFPSNSTLCPSPFRANSLNPADTTPYRIAPSLKAKQWDTPESTIVPNLAASKPPQQSAPNAALGPAKASNCSWLSIGIVSGIGLTIGAVALYLSKDQLF